MTLLRRMGWKPGQGIGARITKQSKAKMKKANRRMFRTGGIKMIYYIFSRIFLLTKWHFFDLLLLIFIFHIHFKKIVIESYSVLLMNQKYLYFISLHKLPIL